MEIGSPWANPQPNSAAIPNSDVVEIVQRVGGAIYSYEEGYVEPPPMAPPRVHS